MSDDELDPEDIAFMDWLIRGLRLGTVSELLAGNDTQCFTTQQYAEAYLKSSSKGFKAIAHRVHGPDDAVWARMHLESLFDVVYEPKSDVWAKL